MECPDNLEIKKAREKAGLTQTEAAKLIYKGTRTWQHWEKGDRDMDPAFWELFISKAGLELSKWFRRSK
jgi:DNA-binding transcriptional regulator YiaG